MLLGISPELLFFAQGPILVMAPKRRTFIPGSYSRLRNWLGLDVDLKAWFLWVNGKPPP